MIRASVNHGYESLSDYFVSVCIACIGAIQPIQTDTSCLFTPIVLKFATKFHIFLWHCIIIYVLTKK